MNAPLRMLRAEARDLLGDRPILTAREEKRERDIIDIAERLMCSHGPAAVTMKILCSSLDMTAAAMQRHFADREELFGRILMRHLQALFDAISKIPAETPDRNAAQRAAYCAYTRTGWGSHTDIHHLLLNYAASLPPDMAQPVERWRRMITGTLVGAEAPSAAMALLDSPDLEPPEIEALLVALRAGMDRAGARRAAAPAASIHAAPTRADSERQPVVPENPRSAAAAFAKPKQADQAAIRPPLAAVGRPKPPADRPVKAQWRRRLLDSAGPFEKYGPSLLEALFEARAGPA